MNKAEKMKDFNLLAYGTDSYKMSHHTLYPHNTEYIYSYCEPRMGGRFNNNVFFGLQYILARYLAGQVVTREKIEEAAEVSRLHFGNEMVFNRQGWEHILEKHKGYLPLLISALPEGTVVPQGTALFTIKNTDPAVPWLTNYVETILMQAWSPITVCSSSRTVKQIIAKYLSITGDPNGLPFKLHDFGYRGVSSVETAALAGAAHLVNFMGTDTMAALSLLRDYYEEPMAGFSIPATEHSIMTALGPKGEIDVVRRILATYTTGLVAMVIDSFDTINFIKNVIGGNRDIVQAIRARKGTVVFRPDSGELPQVDIDVFKALASVFGTETNPKGFHVLPPQVRMIQGDGIRWLNSAFSSGSSHEPVHTVDHILRAFYHEGISADNIAFGSGGGLLQDFTRDTQRFAIKCSAIRFKGDHRWHDVFKAPKTDPTKNSKRGKLKVIQDQTGAIRTIGLSDPDASVYPDMLEIVFHNGLTLGFNTFGAVRERAKL